MAFELKNRGAALRNAGVDGRACHGSYTRRRRAHASALSHACNSHALSNVGTAHPCCTLLRGACSRRYQHFENAAPQHPAANHSKFRYEHNSGARLRGAAVSGRVCAQPSVLAADAAHIWADLGTYAVNGSSSQHNMLYTCGCTASRSC